MPIAWRAVEHAVVDAAFHAFIRDVYRHGRDGLRAWKVIRPAPCLAALSISTSRIGGLRQ
jgi:hypothetical protein